MGRLIYDGSVVEFPDRLLSHLQIVIVQQLRRQQSFAMSWLDSLAVGDGRSSIWLHPACHIYFKFDGSRLPRISQPWLELLTASAQSSQGLIVMNEQGEIGRATEGVVRG